MCVFGISPLINLTCVFIHELLQVMYCVRNRRCKYTEVQTPFTQNLLSRREVTWHNGNISILGTGNPEI